MSADEEPEIEEVAARDVGAPGPPRELVRDDGGPRSPRVLPPMPGWSLRSLSVGRSKAGLEIEAAVNVSHAARQSHQLLARVVCDEAGRAVERHFSLTAPAHLGVQGWPSPAAGDVFIATGTAFGQDGGPCLIDLWTLPYERGPIYALGGAHCYHDGQLQGGDCPQLVRTLPAGGADVGIEELQIDETGTYAFFATVGRRLSGRARLVTRNRCLHGRHLRTSYDLSPMDWHVIQPGESREITGTVAPGERSEACELSIDLGEWDAQTRAFLSTQPVYRHCRRRGHIEEGPCTEAEFGASRAPDAPTPVGVHAVGMRWDREWDSYHLLTTVELTVRQAPAAETELDLEVFCDVPGEIWEDSSRQEAFHQLGPNEHARFVVEADMDKRPRNCAVEVRLRHVLGVTADLGRFCGAPEGRLVPCKGKSGTRGRLGSLTTQ